MNGNKDDTEPVRAHVVISGSVQGVYYRATTRRTAKETGVSGWVRNRADGRVEAVFEGPKSAVDAMIEWSHEGSPGAIVDAVDFVYEQPHGLSSFEIKR